jgi:hypothetical protein
MKRAFARLSLLTGLAASLGCSSTCELNDECESLGLARRVCG